MKTSLFVIHYPIFGGPHNQAIRLNEALENRGWQTIVALPQEEGNAGERLTQGGVAIRRLPLHRIRAKLNPTYHLRFIFGFAGGVRAIRRAIREDRVDLVIVGGLVNPHSAIAARLEGVPVVWQLLDTRAPSPLVRLLMPLVLRLADSVMTTGTAVADAHPGTERLGDRLVSYFPPVDVARFAPDIAKRNRARDNLGIPREAFVVGNVSNINPQKGQGLFVDSAALLRRDRPEVVFAMLGATYSQHTSYLNGIKSSARAQGLELGRDLVIADPGNEVDLYGSALDIFWLTSEPRSEGIPTVVEEAMALGLPVVSTDVGAIREAITDGVNGYVVSDQDPGKFAEKTAQLIADDGLRDSMTKSARVAAEQKFAIDRCADAHLRAFEIALAHKSTSTAR